jgi:hypothetical protein
MLGRTTSSANYLRIVYRSNITGGSEMAEIYDEAATTYTELNYRMYPNTSGSEWSDQASFWRNGYNAFCCIESAYGSNSVNHTINDTLDAPNGLNDTKYLTDCAKASIACLAMDTLAGWTGASIMEQVNIQTSSDIHPHKSTLKLAMQGTNVLITVSDLQGSADIIIYNASGQQIKTIPVKNTGVKSTTIVWESNENAGNSIAQGVYFVQLKEKWKGSVTKKLFYAF